MRLEKPQTGAAGLLTASGAYEFESKRYQVKAWTQNFSLLDLTLPDGKPIRGTIGLQIDSAGTVEEPAGQLAMVVEGLQVDGEEFGAVELSARRRMSAGRLSCGRRFRDSV